MVGYWADPCIIEASTACSFKNNCNIFSFSFQLQSSLQMASAYLPYIDLHSSSLNSFSLTGLLGYLVEKNCACARVVHYCKNVCFTILAGLSLLHKNSESSRDPFHRSAIYGKSRIEMSVSSAWITLHFPHRPLSDLKTTPVVHGSAEALLPCPEVGWVRVSIIQR